MIVMPKQAEIVKYIVEEGLWGKSTMNVEKERNKKGTE